MGDELQIRLSSIEPQLTTILHSYMDRIDEPYIEDNIYVDVVETIKDLDESLLKDVCPQIIINQGIRIIYFRVH